MMDKFHEKRWRFKARGFSFILVAMAICSTSFVWNFNNKPVYDAPLLEVNEHGDIAIGTPHDPAIAGMTLIWQDEFDGNELDLNKWNYEQGYYLNEDPNTWGWGNAELAHYTDDEHNIYVKDGHLNIVALKDAKSFPQDPNRYAEYSSGKINTKGHLSIKYGRVDFRAKLPIGDGLWPAFWMLPDESVYGTWAASGEIDIMEARGRLPGTTSGALHFGGQWPANQYIANEYDFPEGQTFANDFHVYTIIWEEDNIKWYVNGMLFFTVTREQWHSTAAPDNYDAPFDQPFYLIINLAVGGHFDGGLTPSPGHIPATLQVDYVRVYKASNNQNNGIQ